MIGVVSDERAPFLALPELERSSSHAASGPELKVRGATLLSPNSLVRWAFYLSVFSIPFGRLYIPGTGERLGVIRIVQLLLLCGVISQPRVCLRLVPVALLWFAAYAAIRLLSGLWFSPDLWSSWWPNTFEWLQLSLPSVWIMFNLLQFPQVRRKGLWAFAWGCSLCALLHIFGIGVTAVDNNIAELRTTVFGENANLVGHQLRRSHYHSHRAGDVEGP